MTGPDTASDQAPAGRLDDEQLVRHAVAAAKPYRLWVEVVSPRPVPDVRARRLAMYHEPGQVDRLEMRFRRRIDDVLVSPSAPCAPTSTTDIDDAIKVYMSMRAEKLDYEYWLETDDRDFGELWSWWELVDDPDNVSPEEYAEAKAEAALLNGVPPRRSTVPEPSGDDRSPAAPSAPDRDGKRTDRDHSPAGVDPDRTQGSGSISDAPARHRIDRDELLARVDLRALLDALSGEAGERGRWHCPDRDHPDTHPSVTVSVDAAGVQRWRCWSGDHRGTAIDAVVAAQGVGVGDAMRWLADHYGAWPIVERPPAPPAAPVGAPGAAVVDYVQRAERLLWTPAGASQREWLAGRGLDEVVLRLNRVGADPGRRFLPRPKGMPGGWPAVVYPALSPGGTITYAQARYLKPPDGRDKYDNPARSHATNPRVAWLHPTDPPRPGLLVVTEGVADGLIAAQAGFATVGVLGSQYPDDRVVDAITETTQRSPRLAGSTVLVCFDADPSGRAGADRLCALLGARGVPHQPVSPPDGMDLTAWAAAEKDWARRLDPTPRPPPWPAHR